MAERTDWGIGIQTRLADVAWKIDRDIDAHVPVTPARCCRSVYLARVFTRVSWLNPRARADPLPRLRQRKVARPYCAR